MFHPNQLFSHFIAEDDSNAPKHEEPSAEAEKDDVESDSDDESDGEDSEG